MTQSAVMSQHNVWNFFGTSHSFIISNIAFAYCFPVPLLSLALLAFIEATLRDENSLYTKFRDPTVKLVTNVPKPRLEVIIIYFPKKRQPNPKNELMSQGVNAPTF